MAEYALAHPWLTFWMVLFVLFIVANAIDNCFVLLVNRQKIQLQKRLGADHADCSTDSGKREAAAGRED